MKIKVLIRENKQPKTYFLRFGDPTKVSSETSMIHDPEVEQDREEYFYNPEGPKLQQYEKGISAYPILKISSDKVVFNVPLGYASFRNQLSGFLLERLLSGDIYIFKGKKILNKDGTSAVGTDNEPLIQKSTISDVKRIPHSQIYIEENGEHNVYDMLKPIDLKMHFIYGFPHIGNTEKEIREYFANIKQKFSNPDSISMLEEAEKLYIQELE